MCGCVDDVCGCVDVCVVVLMMCVVVLMMCVVVLMMCGCVVRAPQRGVVSSVVCSHHKQHVEGSAGVSEVTEVIPRQVSAVSLDTHTPL